jgi:cytochrome c biogenesis protein CcdA
MVQGSNGNSLESEKKGRHLIKFAAQLAFAIVMFILGIVCLFFPQKYYSWARGNLLDYGKAVYSIRFGGACAVIMGLFVLWMSWRNY